MTDLGGAALCLKPGEIHFGSHEANQALLNYNEGKLRSFLDTRLK